MTCAMDMIAARNITMKKISYSAPKLAVYGGFSQLTAAGSLGQAEGGGNPMAPNPVTPDFKQ